MSIPWDQLVGPYGAFILAILGLWWLVRKNEGLEKARTQQVVDLVTTVKSQGEQMFSIMNAELKTCHDRNAALDGKIYDITRDIIALKVKGGE